MLFRLNLALAAVALTVAAQTPRPNVLADVDPLIGTGEDGHTFPGATVPFGMVQLSPDTQVKFFKQSYKWSAGYRHSDTVIAGFSHTHFSGAGHSDLGDVLVQPISGAVRYEQGDATQPGYHSKFSHSTETATPGYYAVTLEDYGVRAELTATARVGVHRYTFPKDKPAHLLIDMRSSIYNYPGKVLWSRVRVRADGTVTGMRKTRGWAPGRELYFAMRFSQAPTGKEFINREPAPVAYRGCGKLGPGDNERELDSIEGRGLIAVFDFDAKKGPLVVKVGLSPTSEDNAIKNLDAEVPGFDFDTVRAKAVAEWEKALSVVDIQAAPAMRKNLYTALYHTLMAPSISSDVDGSFRGPDNQVHQAKDFQFVSTFSLWDTYRAEQPLMTLIQPDERTNNVVKSLVVSQQYSPYGILPVWQFHGIETWCMIGYHALPVIADAYMKGIRGYDAKAALKAMEASATYAPYGHLGAYMKLGYVPVDNDDEAASKTVEYAYDDWTLARMARAMGANDVAEKFEKRAAYWRNSFDAKTGFVRPRLANGNWREPFDPARAGVGSGFTEGNAWQYSWYVPQDTAGLITQLGGDEKLVAKLDATFDAKVDPKDYAHVEDIAGMIGQYIHGNEPSHQMAYLYNYAGQPWRTQERLKQIIDTQYKPAPDGLVGNDDLGQMSAWLVFSGLGFYPVAPGSNEYVIGRPFVDQATLALPNGKQFKIVADGMSEQNRYVGRVTLNGHPLERGFVRHEEILAGGELRFTMSATPNKTWATKPEARPFSMSAYKR